MNTVITALVFTAILATSALAKNERTITERPRPNNSVPLTSVNHHNNSYCRFHHREADPDPRVWLQIVRDCKHWEID